MDEALLATVSIDEVSLPVRGTLTVADGVATIADASIWCDAREGWRPLGRDIAFPSQWLDSLEFEGPET